MILFLHSPQHTGLSRRNRAHKIPEIQQVVKKGLSPLKLRSRFLSSRPCVKDIREMGKTPETPNPKPQTSDGGLHPIPVKGSDKPLRTANAKENAIKRLIQKSFRVYGCVL